jgi:hypothetical protein
MTKASIVQRVWNYCHTLRDDGVSYGDYLEQLTYLLFVGIYEFIKESLELFGAFFYLIFGLIICISTNQKYLNIHHIGFSRSGDN